MSAWDSRKNNFDFLRLALAVLVVYSHAWPLGLGSEDREPFRLLTHGQLTGGGFAVDSFFIMSGFLITASARRSHGAWSFLSKRIARIYPAFAVCAVLSALFLVPLSGAHFDHPTAVRGLINFLTRTLRLVEFSYHSAFSANPFPGILNGSTWSIAYEFWCYLGVAMLLVAGLLARRGIIACLFLAAWVVSILFRVEGWILGGKILGQVLGPPQIWARLLPLYLAGVVFYLFRERIPRRGVLAAASLVALLAGCWFYAGLAVTFPITGAYLLFWLAFTPRLRLHHIGRFGDFSYGTYLYAFPIEQLLMQHFGHTVAPALLFVCATPLTLAAAVASWYGVERHFLQPARQKETLSQALNEQPAVR